MIIEMLSNLFDQLFVCIGCNLDTVHLVLRLTAEASLLAAIVGLLVVLCKLLMP